MSDPWMSGARSHVGVTETQGARATPAIARLTLELIETRAQLEQFRGNISEHLATRAA